MSTATGKGASQEARQIATALDALVRTVRVSEPQGLPLAERLCQTWRVNPGVVLHFEPLTILAGGRVALEVSRTTAPWVLYASMAGLERLSLRPDAQPEDLVRLALELAELFPTPAAITDFHDFLWSEGAEGFEAVLSAGLVEAQDELGGIGIEPGATGMVRGLGLVAANGIEMLSEDLDAAAIRPEMQVRVDQFVAGAQYGAFDASEHELDQLCGEIEDDSQWTLAEMKAVIEVATLRAGLPSRVFARRIVQRLRPPIGEAVLEVILSVIHSEEPYLSDVAKSLEREGLGARLADGLSMTRTTPELLDRLLEASDPTTRTTVLRGLLERSKAERATLDSLRAIVTMRGSERVAEETHLRTLSGASLDALISVLPPAGPAMVRTLSSIPPAEVPRILSSAPPVARAAVLERTRALLTGDDIELVRELTNLVSLDGTNDEISSAVETLVERRGVGFEREDARRLASAAFTQRVGLDSLVALARSPRTESAVRHGIVDALGQIPELRRRLTGFRISAVFDTGNMRGRVSALRSIDQKKS